MALVDIVNEDGSLTGEFMDRERIHSVKDKKSGRGYLHRVAVGLVFNPKGDRLLYVEGGKGKEYRQNIFWPFVGEHIERGEDGFSAMQRGFKEELGIEVPSEDYIVPGITGAVDLSGLPGFRNVENVVYSIAVIRHDPKKHGLITPGHEIGRVEFRPATFLEMSRELKKYPYEFGRDLMRAKYDGEKAFRGTKRMNVPLALKRSLTTGLHNLRTRGIPRGQEPIPRKKRAATL